MVKIITILLMKHILSIKTKLLYYNLRKITNKIKTSFKILKQVLILLVILNLFVQRKREKYLESYYGSGRDGGGWIRKNQR
jgi:hypothetical protein